MESLVPGRACGACTVCCTILTIDTLGKESGVTCKHCTAGCAIHPARPPVCREFYCGWRMLDIFPDSWRPDLCGVFAQLETQDIPEQFVLRTGISLMLVGPHFAKTLRQSWLLDFVRTGLGENIPLFLSLPGPAGHDAAKLLLNDEAMRDALSSPLQGRLKTVLEKALKRLQTHPFHRHAAN